jgi:protein SCO1/2
LALSVIFLKGSDWDLLASGSSGMHPGVMKELSEISGEVQAVAPGYLDLKLAEGDDRLRRFSVGAGDTLIYKVGDRVRGRVAQRGEETRLESIWPNDPEGNAVILNAKHSLRRDTVTRGSKAYRGIGEIVPDFTLYDEKGEIVHLRSFRGRKVVINFIFSRCAMAEMCPAATTRMSMLQTEAHSAGVENLQLLSVSFDPAYDTPGILASYADSYGIDTDNFSFLTGDEGVINDVLKQFGVDVRSVGGTLNHTMSTILIDERGRIIFRKDGSRWEVGAFLGRIVPSLGVD